MTQEQQDAIIEIRKRQLQIKELANNFNADRLIKLMNECLSIFQTTKKECDSHTHMLMSSFLVTSIEGLKEEIQLVESENQQVSQLIGSELLTIAMLYVPISMTTVADLNRLFAANGLNSL